MEVFDTKSSKPSVSNIRKTDHGDVQKIKSRKIKWKHKKRANCGADITEGALLEPEQTTQV